MTNQRSSGSRRAAIIGFGDLGVQIASLLEVVRGVKDPIVFDDPKSRAGAAGSYPFDRYADEAFADCEFYLGIGYKHMAARMAIAARLIELGRGFPPLVHPSCHVNASACLGPGSVLYPMCNVDRNVRVGAAVLLNNSVVVSHDTSIGDGSFLAPGVVLSGNVEIGPATFIGSGSVVSNGVRLGRHVRVGIGTVVTSDIPDESSAAGNPMRILSKPLSLR